MGEGDFGWGQDSEESPFLKGGSDFSSGMTGWVENTESRDLLRSYASWRRRAVASDSIGDSAGPCVASKTPEPALREVPV